MSGPLIQNFTVPAGNDVDINVDIDPDGDGITLVGSHLFWRVYEIECGMIIPDTEPVLEKYSEDGGIIAIDSDLQKFRISILATDSASLLRNYFHETTIVDPEDNITTLNQGIITFVGTEYRP
jgi:hypothetical protein